MHRHQLGDVLVELNLDREIAYGHTWSPTLELAPESPMLHGHAVSVDMALSATLAAERGYISTADRDRILALMSRLGLAIDSPYLTAELLHEATRSIVQTRDGRLRAAVPRPIGTCFFVNDLSAVKAGSGRVTVAHTAVAVSVDLTFRHWGDLPRRRQQGRRSSTGRGRSLRHVGRGRDWSR